MNTFINNDISFEKIISNPLDNNIWIIFSKQTNKGIIIDAPPDFEKINQIISNLGTLKIENILITHNHYDHIDGIEYMYENLKNPVKIWIGKDDLDKLNEFSINKNDIKTYTEHTNIKLNNTFVKFIPTPGHTNGSTCILIENHIFTGDTLFPGGPGRTSNSNDFKKIIDSIENKLLVLSPNTLVHPGHGADTKIKTSKKEYEIFKYKNLEISKLSGNISW